MSKVYLNYFQEFILSFIDLNYRNLRDNKNERYYLPDGVNYLNYIKEIKTIRKILTKFNKNENDSKNKRNKKLREKVLCTDLVGLRSTIDIFYFRKYFNSFHLIFLLTCYYKGIDDQFKGCFKKCRFAVESRLIFCSAPSEIIILTFWYINLATLLEQKGDNKLSYNFIIKAIKLLEEIIKNYKKFCFKQKNEILFITKNTKLLSFLLYENRKLKKGLKVLYDWLQFYLIHYYDILLILMKKLDMQEDMKKIEEFLFDIVEDFNLSYHGKFFVLLWF